jgi:hypothetical protein
MEPLMFRRGEKGQLVGGGNTTMLILPCKSDQLAGGHEAKKQCGTLD